MLEMSAVRQAVQEAFWAMCAADSLSMPVHWYYDVLDIKKDFGGWISGFNVSAERHPSSILTLSNTGTTPALIRCYALVYKPVKGLWSLKPFYISTKTEET